MCQHAIIYHRISPAECVFSNILAWAYTKHTITQWLGLHLALQAILIACSSFGSSRQKPESPTLSRDHSVKPYLGLCCWLHHYWKARIRKYGETALLEREKGNEQCSEREVFLAKKPAFLNGNKNLSLTKGKWDPFHSEKFELWKHNRNPQHLADTCSISKWVRSSHSSTAASQLKTIPTLKAQE